MILSEIKRDNDPLLLGLLNNLLKKGAHIHCDFQLQYDPTTFKHQTGELFEIERRWDDATMFSISGEGAFTEYVIVTFTMMDDMRLTHRSKDEHRDEWDLEYTEERT